MLKKSRMDIKIPMFLVFFAVLLGAVLITSKCYETGACEGQKQGRMDEAEKQLHYLKCRDSKKKEGKSKEI